MQQSNGDRNGGINGYAGKILRVDLSNAKIDAETPNESFYRKYVGGASMGMGWSENSI